MSGTTINSLPSQEELRALFDYDTDTGLFRRKANGKPAFVTTSHGYRVGYVHGFSSKLAAAHRVAFKYVYGRDPDGQIDHINGDRSDNRISNLREATALDQRKNAAMPRTNTSGIVGVSYRPDKRRWRAHITVGNKAVHLGYFHTKEAAISARVRAQADLGFHPNHGRRQWAS